MAAVNSSLSEDQFLCCICLEVFTDPVSAPCGHNFCKCCINKHWDNSDLCQCPMCKEVFNTRPLLQVNTFISEMVSQFRNRAPQEEDSVSSEQPAAEAGEVLCDVCPEPKLKALKSCLVCLLSYCQSHLEPHLTLPRLKKHELLDPVENLEDRMCPKHDKPLELFCRTDQSCVCMMCTILNHKSHDIVPLKEEYEEQQTALKQTETETQQMMEERRLKIQEIKHSVVLSQKQRDREMAEGVRVYTALMESVQRSLDQFKEEVQEKQRRTEKQAKGLITELELEISELKKRSTEVEQLSRSEDHLHFLQTFTSLKTVSNMKDWTQVNFVSPLFEGTAVSQLQDTLTKQMKKLSEAELKRLQQWAVDVTLDPETASPSLVLSADLKQVYYSGVKKTVPDNPERFSVCSCVLAKQSFSSGRFYFEVQVKGKTQWDLGVANESINRKKKNFLKPQNGFWTIILRDGGKYKACAAPSVTLSLKSVPQRIGVFVDYDQGLVSFYDVDTAALIYSFTGCTFSEKLFPYFSQVSNDEGKNLAPLVIMSVNILKLSKHQMRRDETHRER